MKEKGIYTKAQVMDDADELFHGIEIEKLDKMERALIGGTDKLDYYENVIVENFESSTKDEVAEKSKEIMKVFEQYEDLKDMAKLKLDILIYENSEDEGKIKVLEDFKENLFPALEKKN